MNSLLGLIIQIINNYTLIGLNRHCYQVNAFIENNNIKPMMLEAAWQKNLEVREDKDWLDIEGAVTKRRLV